MISCRMHLLRVAVCALSVLSLTTARPAWADDLVPVNPGLHGFVCY